MPTRDLSRMSTAQALQAVSTRLTSSMNGLAKWLEVYATKLVLGTNLQCQMEPRSILTVVSGTMEK
eukprot:1841502-Prorocentrum_lima.AAC.1